MLPSVQPGYLSELLPQEVPDQPESWQQIMRDLNEFIMPGITHWQSPNFHAYYPLGTSYPSIVADMLCSGFGVLGLSWFTSPACTELEVIMMDWLAKLLHLPDHFTTSSPGRGGGVIQGSASEAVVVALIVGRELTVKRYRKSHPEMSESEVRGKLVAYTSDQSNSCIEKAGILAAVPMRLLPTDEKCALRGATLRKAIEEDVAAGLIPCAVLATLGTTPTCAFDNLSELGPVCQERGVYLHVDAAYAGSAFCCEEYAYMRRGLEFVDSLNVNMHKAMLVNFDCCAMWMRDSDLLVKAMTVERTYLSHHYENVNRKAPDMRHYTIALGRRMRSLKVWFTLRSYGAENIRGRIRKHAEYAQMFEGFVRDDVRFEVVTEAVLSLVVFRLKAGCEKTKELLDRVTEKKKIYMVAGTIHGSYGIRFVVGGMEPEEKDIVFAWDHIKETLAEIEAGNSGGVVEESGSVEDNGEFLKGVAGEELKVLVEMMNGMCDKEAGRTN